MPAASAQLTVTPSPVLSRAVAFPVPTTAGTPSSRATMAAWQVRPLNEAGLAGGDLLADRLAGRQHRPLPIQPICLDLRDIGLDPGDRPGLHDIELSVLAVLGPFDIHRGRLAGQGGVMLLDLDRQRR